MIVHAKRAPNPGLFDKQENVHSDIPPDLIRGMLKGFNLKRNKIIIFVFLNFILIFGVFIFVNQLINLLKE